MSSSASSESGSRSPRLAEKSETATNELSLSVGALRRGTGPAMPTSPRAGVMLASLLQQLGGKPANSTTDQSVAANATPDSDAADAASSSAGPPAPPSRNSSFVDKKPRASVDDWEENDSADAANTLE